MLSLFNTLFFVLAISTKVLAQNTTALPFAACLLDCDEAALAAVNCTAADTLCHCHNAPALFALIVPCVFDNSTCGSATEADLIAFGSFAAETCVPYNLTVPDISTYFPANATGNATVTPVASKTPTPTAPLPTSSAYTGNAGTSTQAGSLVALAGFFGLALML